MFLNLQAHEAVQGTKIVYMFRRHSQAATEAAWNVAYTTENEKTISVDSDSTPTKSGTIRTPGQPEIELTGTSLLKKGDEKIDEMENACRDSELMEIWEADLTRPGTATGTYKGRYYQGYITEFGKSTNAEDYAEISLTFGVNGKGTDINDVTVPDAIIEDSDYVFVDTKKTGV